LDETNYSELVKEKTSIFDESELALSWTIYNLYKIAKIDGNFAFFFIKLIIFRFEICERLHKRTWHLELFTSRKR
jgi:hypothetical protein